MNQPTVPETSRNSGQGSRRNGRPTAWIWALVIVGGGIAAHLADRFVDPYYLSVAGFVGIYIILVSSLNVTNGYTGLFSLGHPAFMAVGAYLTTILAFPAGPRKALLFPELPALFTHNTIPFGVALVIGALGAVILALVVGFPVARLRGHYLALATLAVIIVVAVLLTNMRGYTRGPLGINGIPPRTTLLWIYACSVITLLAVHRIATSNLGRALEAIRDDEHAAAALGIPVGRYRLFALAFGAAFAGIAGALWAHLVTAITPNTFSVAMSFQLVVMVVVGGAGSFWGPVIGASFLTVLTELIRPIESRYQVYGISQIITALILIAFLAFRPQGIIPATRRVPGLSRGSAGGAGGPALGKKSGFPAP